MANANGGFWKGFVYGLLTPLGVGVGLTLLASIAVAIGGTKRPEING